MRGSATRLAGAIVLTTLVVSGCSGAKTKTLAAVATVPVAVGSSPLLAAGQQHTLAPGPNGELLAWGDNASGELGDGTGHQATGPVTVTGLDGHGRVASVDAGSTHSLAVMEDGTVFAWGHNASGQLGDGSKQDSLVPKQIEAVHDVRAVATGEGFSLVLESDGSVWAWGNNQSGELGDAKAPEDHTKPAMVYGLGPGSDVVAISAGHSFGLVLKGDGAVLGWGNDASGQLGDDTTGKQSAPTPVHGLGAGSGVIAISAGDSFSLALKSDGSVLAWGNNQSGQLGDGQTKTDEHVPTPVTGLGAGSGVTAISAGYTFSLALKSDDSVLAWGNNRSGELGDGQAPTDQGVPTPVVGLAAGSGVAAIAGGGSHSVVLLRDGKVLSFGNNSHGQLGDGAAPTDSPVPVPVVISG